jgi:hypothetical protein
MSVLRSFIKYYSATFFVRKITRYGPSPFSLLATLGFVAQPNLLNSRDNTIRPFPHPFISQFPDKDSRDNAIGPFSLLPSSCVGFRPSTQPTKLAVHDLPKTSKHHHQIPLNAKAYTQSFPPHPKTPRLLEKPKSN